MKTLAWRYRNAIETRTRELSFFGPLNREQAERTAIVEIATAEKAKIRAAGASVHDLLEPAWTPNPVPPGFWAAKGAEFKRRMMTPLRLEPTPPEPPPSPIARPSAPRKKQPPATGEPTQAIPRPSEPLRSAPLLYVAGTRTATSLMGEFRHDRTTENWLASLRGAR